MMERLREGIEGRSYNATLRLYLFNLWVLALFAASVLFLSNLQTLFQVTPLLVIVLVSVQYFVLYHTKPQSINAEDLGEIGNSRTFESSASALIASLRDENPVVRRGAIEALSKIGELDTIEPLIASLKDEDTVVRYWAVVALRRISDPRAIAALRDEDSKGLNATEDQNVRKTREQFRPIASLTTLGAIVRRIGQLHAVSANDTVYKAVLYLINNNIGAVIVVEGEHFVGLFSERDLMKRVVAQGRDPQSVRVREVMTTELTIASPDETYEDGIRKMQRARCRHLPVIDGNKLLGLVSLRDLLEVDADEKAEERQLFYRDLDEDLILFPLARSEPS